MLLKFLIRKINAELLKTEDNKGKEKLGTEYANQGQ